MTINGLKAIVLCWKLFLLIHVYMYIMCHSKVSWGADNSAPSSFSVFFPSLSVSLVVSELISWFISNHLVLTHVRHTCQTVQCLVSVTRGKVNCREQYSLVYSYWTRSSNNVRLLSKSLCFNSQGSTELFWSKNVKQCCLHYPPKSVLI